MVQLLGRGSQTPIRGTRDERIFAIAGAQRSRIGSNTIDRRRPREIERALDQMLIQRLGTLGHIQALLRRAPTAR